MDKSFSVVFWVCYTETGADIIEVDFFSCFEKNNFPSLYFRPNEKQFVIVGSVRFIAPIATVVKMSTATANQIMKWISANQKMCSRIETVLRLLSYMLARMYNSFGRIYNRVYCNFAAVEYTIVFIVILQLLKLSGILHFFWDLFCPPPPSVFMSPNYKLYVVI